MLYLPALIDTDILSELFKGHALVKTNAAAYIRKHNLLTISHIAKYEILKGLKAKKAEKQIEAFQRFCLANRVLPITDDAVVKAADIFALLKEKGAIISDADILVAAIALTNNLILVTNNTRHFSNINDLTLHNWKAEGTS